MRNGVWAWPLERQRAALGDLLEPATLFQDVLRDDRAKAPSRVRAEWLTERAAMLRPSSRQSDVIHVATLLVLAVSEADLVAVLAAAEARNTSIVVPGYGVVFYPHTGADGINHVVLEWQRAKTEARSAPGRLEGVRVAAEKKRARTMRAVKIARPLWRDTKPNRPTAAQIGEQVGLSEKTLYSELGRRPAIKKGRSA